MALSEKPKDAPVNAHVNESVYTAEELAVNHKIFGASYDIVKIALQMAGKKEASVSEAKKIIEKFKTKEVK